MIIIKHPPCCINEYNYIVKIIFSDFLGIEYRTVESGSGFVEIEYDNRHLKLPDIFFQKAEDDWLGEATLPEQPLPTWDTSQLPLQPVLTDPDLPVIYGKGGWKKNGEHAQLDIDIFGSAFFMLSRYEEAVKKDRDQHDRFPATASLAYQENFLERPIINEYIEILWACMKDLWPQLQRKKRVSRTLVSCDVDQPYLAGIKNIRKQIRQTGGDLLKRKDVKRAVHGVVNYFATKSGNFSFDANYTIFDWMMEVNEAAGNKVAFYFKPEQTDPKMDADYTLDEPVIQSLIRRIHERGHEIGLHTSYHTYLNPQQTTREADMLRQMMEKLGIQQDTLGGRQHYLRWKTPETACNWDAAGMDYDSTLSFADHIGFRCGVCYEYPMYDLIGRKQLAVRQRPLVVMEGTVFGEDYMGLGYDEQAMSRLNELKCRCWKVGGDFTLLWHNSSFLTEKDRSFYKGCIRGI